MSSRNKRADREGKFSGHTAHHAIIDIGSNTVRLVIYGGSSRAPITLLNEKVVAKLGRDIGETGRLADPAIEIAMRGLSRYALILEDLGVAHVDVVATAAVREAENGPDFLQQVRALGLKPRLLSGEDEGRISAMGVIGAFPGASGVVADLGGGSLELVHIAGGECSDAISLPLGTLRLPELRGDKPADTKKAAGQVLKSANWDKPIDGPLYLVGGTWRAMAVYAMNAQSHPLSDPHGLEISRDDAIKLAAEIAASDPDNLRQMPRISSQRSATMPDAGALLLALLNKLDPPKIVFSSWGLREGLLFDRLEPYARGQDPLLAGVAVFAAQRGCPATLATRVASWTVDALPSGSRSSERLRLAATMLSLASMQTEPNLRTNAAIDWALHKRWIALSSEDRAMLAAAVSANGNNCDLPGRITDLAPAELLDEAIAWGLAIRLCRRLGALSRRAFHATSLAVEDNKLVLSLEQDHAALFGAPSEKDLRLLGECLGFESQVVIVPDDSIEQISVLPGGDIPAAA
jgi:exopolyphosphatase/guanosine-5'-triphosphate,3'-diphosphate pyrophosphatase